MSFSPRSILDSSLFVRWLPLSLLVVTVLYYFWFVYSNAINIPYQDDILDFLLFINQVESADSAGGAIQEWYRQYNEHRTSASRLQVYAAYLVQGEVNFHTLALLGNVALPLILFLFYLSVRQEKYRWVYVLVAALLLLHLRAYRIVLWGQPAFAYYYVYFYAFACMFFLHRVTPARFVLAALFCSLSSLTFASGQIAWLLGWASLLHQALVIRRISPLYCVTWLMVAVAMLLVWRIGYIPASIDVAPEDVVKLKELHPDLLLEPTLSEALLRYGSFVLVVLGSAITLANAWLAGVFGAVMLAVLVFATLRFYKHEDIRLVLCCWFTVATVAAVAVGRAALGEPGYILGANNRYGFFSVMLLCTLAMLAQQRFRVFKTHAMYLFVLLAATYSVWSYRQFAGPLNEFMSGRYESYNMRRYQVFGYLPGEMAAIVKESVSQGRYAPPCRPFPDCQTSSSPGG